MNFGLIHSVWTVLLLITFIGIVAWAWSGKRKRTFEAAARAPLEEADEVNSASADAGEKPHG
jgi:cytochrome c oxidase cbb3-type subunit IV